MTILSAHCLSLDTAAPNHYGGLLASSTGWWLSSSTRAGQICVVNLREYGLPLGCFLVGVFFFLLVRIQRRQRFDILQQFTFSWSKRHVFEQMVVGF
jgi:hypothetical protein